MVITPAETAHSFTAPPQPAQAGFVAEGHPARGFNPWDLRLSMGVSGLST
jgi:hypothetical protein